RALSASSWIDSRTLCRMTGLYTLSWKFPCEPANATAWSFPNTCTATMVSASHCVGLILPGMIDEPGSFSGMRSSANTARGPQAHPRDTVERLIELRHPAGDHLAESQRRRVLEMRPADHHHGRERPRLGVQRIPQRPDRGRQHVDELLDRGDVHGGRKGVVGGLAVVHVVVRMDRLLRSHRPAGELDRAVRDHLV